MKRPNLSITRWPKNLLGRMHGQGQALVEYVLILSLVIVSLAAILSITGPAVGNVFSNTVANLLDLTVTPEDPMTEGDFWDLVTAVASYTPDTVSLVTNTPPPVGDQDGDGVLNNVDNCPTVPNPGQEDADGNGIGNVCEPTMLDLDGDGYLDAPCPFPYPTSNRTSCDNCPLTNNPSQADGDNDGIGDACEAAPTATHTYTITPGPSPTPQDSVFPYPFTDTGDRDNFETDFNSLLKGPWTTSYWNEGDPSCSNSGSNRFNLAGTPNVTTLESKIDFPYSTHPSWTSTSGKGAPALSNTNFCGRFSSNFNITADTYTWRVLVSDNDRVRIKVDGTNIYNDWATASNGRTDGYQSGGTLTTEFSNSGISGNNPRLNGNFVEFDWIATTTKNYNITVEYADRSNTASLRVFLTKGALQDKGECNWTSVTSDNANSITPPPGISAFWSDSPNGATYQSSSFCILRLRGTINLTGASLPFASWQDRHDIASGDTFWLAVRRVGETDWYMRAIHNTTNANLGAWVEREVNLSNFQGVLQSTGTAAAAQNFIGSNIEVAFIIESDSSTNKDGWFIANFQIKNKTFAIFPFPYLDDFEGLPYWRATPGTGAWATTSSVTRSGTKAWTDSSGNYSANQDTWLQLDGLMDFRDTGLVFKPQLSFWHRYALSTGTQAFVEISRDYGDTWQALRSSTTDTTDSLQEAGTELIWKQVTIPLDITTASGADQNLIGELVMIRFRLKTGSNLNDGWYIDDLAIRNEPITGTIFPNWCDNFNNAESLDNWSEEGTWNLGNATIGRSNYSSPTAITDSPSDYTVGTDPSLILDRVVNVSAATNPIIEFWHRWEVSNNAVLRLEISEDEGVSWGNLWSITPSAGPSLYDSSVKSGQSWNEQRAWQREVIFLNGQLSPSNTDKEFRLRWRLDVRTAASADDGWYLDNVCIREYDDPTLIPAWEDDFEGSLNSNWYRLEWGNTNAASVGWYAVSGSQIADAYANAAPYDHNTDSVMELKGVFDLTNASISEPTLYFWEAYIIGAGDYFYTEVLEVNAQGVPQGTWKPVARVSPDSRNYAWVRRQVDLNAYKGKYVRLRFRMQALNNSGQFDGPWIEDVRLVDRADVEGSLSLPFAESGSNAAVRWVSEGEWGTVNATRTVGSASALGAGLWSATYYEASARVEPAPAGFGGYAAFNPGATIASESVAEIDFNWGNSAPAAILAVQPGRVDGFMARYRRTVVFTVPTSIDIQIKSDDGHALNIDGLYIPVGRTNWQNSSEITTTYTHNFTPGTHVIEIEYYEDGGGAKISATFAVTSGSSTSVNDPFGSSPWQAMYFDYCGGADFGLPMSITPESVPVLDFNHATQSLPSTVQTMNGTAPTAPIPAFTAISNEISIPAELYHSQVTSGVSWNLVTSTPGYYDWGGMRIPNGSGLSATSDTTRNPQLNYIVRFPSTGTWYASVRLYGPDPDSDSVHLRFSAGPVHTGNTTTYPTGITPSGTNAWGWSTLRFSFNVPAANTNYTLSMTPREDGVIADHITLNQSNSTPTTGNFSRYCYTGNPREYWSAQYVRTINVTEETAVTLNLNSNDGHRLYVDLDYPGGVPNYTLLASQWADTGSGNRVSTVNYTFPVGTHLLRVDYASKSVSDDSSSSSTPNLRLTYSFTNLAFHSDKTINGIPPDYFDSSLILEEPIALPATPAALTWWDRYSIGAGNTMVVEVNTVGGDDPAVGGASTWTRIYERAGAHTVDEWRQRFVDLSAYANQNIVVRFRLIANQDNSVGDGWYIDDIVISN